MRIAGICLVIWLWASLAWGQAVPMDYGGAPGVWLPLPEAREAVTCLVDRESLRRRVSLLTESLSIADAQAETLRLAIEQAEARTAAALTQVGEVQAERDAWYRSPFLWASLGLILGAGVAIAAMLGAGT